MLVFCWGGILSRSAVVACCCKNGLSQAVELGAFMVTASLAHECLDLASVRLPPKYLTLFCPEGLESAVSMHQNMCWSLPAHSFAGKSEGTG